MAIRRLDDYVDWHWNIVLFIWFPLSLHSYYELIIGGAAS